MKKKTYLIIAVMTVIFFLTGCFGMGEEEKENQFYGMLKISSYKPDTLNPILTENNANLRMLKLIFEPLIICDEEQRPVPVLADSYSISDDGLTWTVNLNQNVVWHDGAPFTAEDVEFTYNIIMDSDGNNRYSDNLKNVTKITHLSDYTIVFNLEKPQTNFINLLNIPIIKNAENFKPVGTGPYMYGYKKNKSIILKANENWHGEPLPTIANIEVKILPDKDLMVYAFTSSEVDVAVPKMTEWTGYAGYSDYETAGFPSGNFNFIYLNTENKYLKIKEIRQAIVLAINKRRIKDEVLLGHGNITDTIINPAWWMYNASAAEKYAFDAKSAVAKVQNNIPAGSRIKLKLLVNSKNDIKLNVSGIIRECLSEAGIDVDIVFADWDNYLQTINDGNYDMYLGEICYSPEINPEYVLGENSRYKKLLDNLQKQTTEEGKKMVYYELQEKVARDIPLVPLYFDVETVLYNNRISGDLRPLRDNVFYNINNWVLDGFKHEVE